METLRSVIVVVQEGEFLTSLDLMMAYSHTPYEGNTSATCVCSVHRTLSVQSSTLWSGYCFMNVHESHDYRRSCSVLRRETSPPLPGQLTDLSKVSGGDQVSNQEGDQVSAEPRIGDQLREEPSLPLSEADLFGGTVRHQKGPGVPTARQSEEG